MTGPYAQKREKERERASHSASANREIFAARAAITKQSLSPDALNPPNSKLVELMAWG